MTDMVKSKMQKTSLTALKSIQRSLSKNHQKIFDLLVETDNKGLTAKEIEIYINMRSASSRINEMIKLGWIVRTDKQRRNPGPKGPETGSSADILVIPKHVIRGETPIHLEDTKTHILKLIRGVKGNSIYINNYRIAGPNPSLGIDVELWKVSNSDLKNAIKK